ncbi:MAG: transglutaminase-like cysteine peptidase [Candidatus Bathyarchaeia archaeon]
MFEVGIPEKRKFVAPLEGLEWILVDEEPDSIKLRFLEDPILLTEYAWKNSSPSDNFKSEKWNFEDATDRLNDPRLITIYDNNNFKFVDDWTQFGKNDSSTWQSAREMYKNKKGDCEDFAAIHTYWLVKNGYEAKGLFENFQSERSTGHAVTIFRYNHDLFLHFGQYTTNTRKYFWNFWTI